jgi:hypothetical protein
MDNVITWITTNWPLLVGSVYFLVSAVGQFVGFFNGPKAQKARGIFDTILDILRRFGAGTYKDEPGTNSVPFFSGDSGKRIVDGQVVSIK